MYKFITFTIYAISSMVLALLYGVFSYYIIYRLLAGKVMLTAYLLNIVFIFVILIVDKVLVDRFIKSNHLRYFQESYSKKGKFAKILYTVDMITFKSSLYLFYIICLFIARISYFGVETNISSETLYFLASIEYCVYLLIAIDKFAIQIQKDKKLIDQIAENLSKRKNKFPNKK